MFTGIIQAVGTIAVIKRHREDLNLAVELNAHNAEAAHELKPDQFKLGDSVAVNGVCLTVVAINPLLHFDVSAHSLSRTLMADYRIGQRVNLESALTPTTALGGHLVSGHVDDVATLASIKDDGRSSLMEFRAGRDYARFIAVKGSVCIDGVSLTVNSVTDTNAEVRFEINIVPHTLEHTIMGDYQIGTKVHMEIDQVARYLERLIAVREMD